MKPYAEERAAVLRLIQEINAFTDHSDYCSPESVRKAIGCLSEIHAFTDGERYSYPLYAET